MTGGNDTVDDPCLRVSVMRLVKRTDSPHSGGSGHKELFEVKDREQLRTSNIISK